jgi:hypothetical protein
MFPHDISPNKSFISEYQRNNNYFISCKKAHLRKDKKGIIFVAEMKNKAIFLILNNKK